MNKSYMKLKDRFLAAVFAPFALLAGTASAATLVTSTFTSVRLESAQDIDVTGSTVVDWGYYEENDTLASAFDNFKAVSGIGTVSRANGAISGGSNPGVMDAITRFTMTFDDGDSPTAGTVEIGRGFGAWGASEDGAMTFTFNDLGVGTHTVQVIVGHESNTRVFDMDYSVTATDGALSGNTLSNSTTGSGFLHSTYALSFSTTDASADVELTLNSTSGGSGAGWVGGYVVETVPEPSVMLLGCFASFALLRRRR